MTDPIRPSAGAPIQRTANERPAAKGQGDKFTLPDSASGDTVSTRTLLSGSLGSMVNPGLTSAAAVSVAQQMEKLLTQESLSVVNNRPDVVAGLFDPAPPADKA